MSIKLIEFFSTTAAKGGVCPFSFFLHLSTLKGRVKDAIGKESCFLPLKTQKALDLQGLWFFSEVLAAPK